MEQVVTFIEQYLHNHPPPVPLLHRWFGLTYINVIWQDRMVSGMTLVFLGSFVIVFAMMSILFRSPLWGLLCMLPLTITIIILYGIIGFIGKDYDMPAAIESALSLGLAVDFAIHFLARSRELVQRHGSWERAVNPMFGAPARAISRNAIMVALGFVPLVAAPLVPYQTVGFFLSAIMAVSGIGTLIILPALIRVFQDRLFSPQEQARFVQTAK